MTRITDTKAATMGAQQIAEFAKPAASVAQALGVDPDVGLTGGEIEARRIRYGPNQLRAHTKQSAFVILAHQFEGVIVWLLAFAAGMSFYFHDFAEGIAITVVLAINAAIGFFTELRAARSMEALLSIASVTARVRRGGQAVRIDAHDLVVGDIVLLDAGDMIAADLRLVEASNLQCDQSVLTGESVPVDKKTDPVAPDAMIGDRSSMVFKGTAITQGSGIGIVTATGMSTELGHISHLVQSADASASPLEKRLDRLGHRLVWLTLGLAVLVIGAGILRGHDITAMVQTGVALAVAAVPEGLPVVATLSLARGMWRMAARNAIISNLSSVETLGATTVILTDKTGTLTENRMTVVRYLVSGAEVDVTRPDDNMQFESEGQLVDPEQDTRLRDMLRVGALCNGASLGQGGEAPAGDPMELALLRVAGRADPAREPLLQDCEKVREHAFDQDSKMMATVHRNEGGFQYAIKGAPEAVMDVCTHVLGPDGTQKMDAAARADWLDRSATAAADGLRLLAMATKQTDRDDAAPYEGLTLVGMVCLRDPLREDVASAIAAARAAGVRVVMMTGDHADTAAAIAQQAGLGTDARDLIVIEGQELADFDPDATDGALRDRILAADVFARVTPATKLNLATLYQANGHIVAMTGDGVNDAPALKKADIGIAMGQRGTEVAREAAHMVLRDDSFGTIIAAMRQGRVIFDNIRKFVIYLMSCNVSEVLIVGLAVGVGLPMPLLPLQILFLNLVTDVFPAFALGLGAGDETVMGQPPRDPAEEIIDRSRWTDIGVLGGVITLATLVAFWLALHWLMLDVGPAVTVAFLTLALAQLWNVFNVRVPGGQVFVNDVTRNPWIWGAITLCLGLIAAALWVPGLSSVLQLPDPGGTGLLLAAVASLVPLVIGQIYIILRPVHLRTSYARIAAVK
ncbi:cation-transporting P-type ATPase [Aliiroseovarius sp. S1339]|uniref:cation-translocating P-type ATPase n=1 Tax=Aliiroseovarius sp. S1339 TaxID=2936990 RepID=UPI0020BDBAC3|nr:cation-transporting P-type ATPase [Aliiroseovarius sp. S1339]MCK8465534.1 cation-transporting P-type ATPase [Aliiroseovarius sp. S1339]